MARVMIRCPTTLLPLQTGLSMDLGPFEKAPLNAKATRCPHCGDLHRWDKADAWLEDDAS